MKHRNQDTRLFKSRALELVKESGKSLVRVAKELDIKPNPLSNWYRRALHKADVAIANQ